MIKQNLIGVFDSGIGGISVLKELKKMMPKEDYIYFGDSQYAPYGEKSKEAISKRCIYICDFLIKHGVKAIVVACNTATSACIAMLREKYADIPIIGMEPALKVAAERFGKQHILVLATNFTLKEQKFVDLMKRYEKENIIYKQPCPKLVEIIEKHQLQDKQLVKDVLKNYLAPYDLQKINSIVLGCTHFVFYRDVLESLLAKHIVLIDGNYGTAKHVQEILCEKKQLNTTGSGEVLMFNSQKGDKAKEIVEELLNA